MQFKEKKKETITLFERFKNMWNWDIWNWFWPWFRGLGTLLFLILSINAINNAHVEKDRCGTVVHKNGESYSGSKGHVYYDEYIIMQWSDDNALKRIDVNSETFFKLKEGDKTCFTMNEYVKDSQEKIYVGIFLAFLFWWTLIGMQRMSF